MRQGQSVKASGLGMLWHVGRWQVKRLDRITKQRVQPSKKKPSKILKLLQGRSDLLILLLTLTTP